MSFESSQRGANGASVKHLADRWDARRTPDAQPSERIALAVVSTQKSCASVPAKHSLYHAHLDFDGTCRGYERHMRRGSAVRSVYGYLVAILEKHPNPLNYVFPSKRRIQEQTYKWIRVSRKKWVKSDEHYSRRQIYSALRLLARIDAITASQNGWLIRRHEVWAEKVNIVCRVRKLEEVLREKIARKDVAVEESSGFLAPVLPKNARTRVTVLEHVFQRKGKG